jgi:hypothetical protein
MNFAHSRRSSRNRSARSRNRASGIALVSVLWLLLLLSGLAVTVAVTARLGAVITHQSLDLARAQAAADAAIVNCISRLSDEEPVRRPKAGVPESWTFEGVPTFINLTNEASRLDVNASADGPLLELFHFRGLDEAQANALLNKLRAWQVGRGNERLHSLDSIDDLFQIPGWNDPRLLCWKNFLTVYTGQSDRSRPESDSSSSKLASLAGEVVRIRAVATAGTASGVAEWVGRVTGNPANPTLTMYWEHVTGEAESCL